MGRDASRKVREGHEAERRRVVILSLEQPVVDLEPDRSDPRMRLKQNWSFQARGRVSIDCRSIDNTNDARFGDESNQVP